MIVKRVSSVWADPAIYLPLVYLCLSFPLLALQRSTTTGRSIGEVNIAPLLASYVILALAAFWMCRYRSVLRQFLAPGDLLFLLFVASIMASTFAHGSLRPLIQAGVLLTIALGIRVASMSTRFFAGLQIASLCMLVFMVFAVVVFGPPEQRWIKGIHPNIFGGVAVASAILATFGSLKKFEISAAVCFFFALYVSSRFAMVAIFLLYLTFWLLNIRRVGIVRLVLAAIAVYLLAADFFLSSSYGFVGRALELNSANRGLSSGLTGRDQLWLNFSQQFDLRPMFGYGFRNREAYSGAHNGFLNLILENGLLGSVPILGFYAHRFIAVAREALSTPRAQIRGRYFAGMVSVTFGAMLQPQVLSFGDSFSYTVLLLLFAAPGSEQVGSALGKIARPRRMTRSAASNISDRQGYSR